MKRMLYILTVISLVLSLASCGEMRYDEAEVLSQAEVLIMRSEQLNELYWGEGIPYENDISYANGYYFRANEPLLNLKYGGTTVDYLKRITRLVFSENYCESIFSGAFKGISDDDGIYAYARYYQKYSDAEMKEPECIMVYSHYVPFLTDEVEYLYDTLKVSHSDRERVYVNIDARVTRENKTQTETITVGLVLENGVYKIDTPTYLTYNETEN